MVREMDGDIGHEGAVGGRGVMPVDGEGLRQRGRSRERGERDLVPVGGEEIGRTIRGTNQPTLIFSAFVGVPGTGEERAGSQAMEDLGGLVGRDVPEGFCAFF
jgi:hypothetical protein